MEPRIDVHLLTPNEPAEWRGLHASLEGTDPVARLPGIPGRIGEARAAGYAQGHACRWCPSSIPTICTKPAPSHNWPTRWMPARKP